MPLYDYECAECEEGFEESHRIDERETPTKKPCPKCGKRKVILKVTCQRIGDPFVYGLQKPSPAYREVMSSIAKKGGPRVKSNLSGKY